MYPLEATFADLMKCAESRTIAVALSGGADSLALTFLADNWAKTHDGKIIALTVDHGLRKESAMEAMQVAKWMEKADIQHQILTYAGKKPTSGIPDEARNIRYNLLVNWCKDNAITELLVAHHMEDQAETFLMRLQRGSGVDGLAAMAVVSYKNGIRVLRPLLSVSRNRLRDYLKAKNHQWIEDPTNQNTSYTRNRLRKLLLTGGDSDHLIIKRLCDTARSMARAREALELQTHEAMASCITFHAAGFCIINTKKIIELPEEIALRILSKALTSISGNEYPPRFAKLNNLFEVIKSNQCKKGRTLWGCKIREQGSDLIIFREINAIEPDIVINAGDSILWDKRFIIKLNKDFSQKVSIGALGSKGWSTVYKDWPEIKNNKIPKEILYTLPCLKIPVKQGLSRILSIPHINFYSKGCEEDMFSCSLSPTKPLAGYVFDC